jgi:DNA-binding NarL/FixJ family response regulator
MIERILMKNNLIIASPNRERNLSWQQGLNDFVNTFILTDRFDMLWDDVARIKPEVVLLDFDLLQFNGLNGAAILNKFCTETKVIILSGDMSEDLEWELYMAGVRGCCQRDVTPEYLNQVVMAINNGELWMRRSLTCRLGDELGKTTSKNKAYRATPGLLHNLTPREHGIAMCVGNGESNKQIAQSCAITERTVKAHLTEIYLKLGITDRLNLALMVTADDPFQQRGELQLQ